MRVFNRDCIRRPPKKYCSAIKIQAHPFSASVMGLFKCLTVYYSSYAGQSEPPVVA